MRNATLVLAVLTAGVAYGFTMGAGVHGGYAEPLEEYYEGQGFAGAKVLFGVVPVMDVEVDFSYYFDGEWLGMTGGPRFGIPAGPINILANGGVGYTVITKKYVNKEFILYVGSGIEYPFNKHVAFEANPQFGIIMSNRKFKFVDLGAGLDFYFM